MPKSKPRRCKWKRETFIVVHILLRRCWTSKCVQFLMQLEAHFWLHAGIKSVTSHTWCNLVVFGFDREDPHRVVDYRGGSLMATGSKDRAVHLLFVASEIETVSVMKGHVGSIRAVLLCEDRDLVITAGCDASIRWGGRRKLSRAIIDQTGDTDDGAFLLVLIRCFITPVGAGMWRQTGVWWCCMVTLALSTAWMSMLIDLSQELKTV